MDGRVIDALPDDQRRALELLAPLVGPAAYLAEGVAVAFHVHHRRSRDLDLFTPASEVFDGDALAIAPVDVKVLERGPGTCHLRVLGVPASVLRYRYPLLASPVSLPDLPVPVASLDDLIAMKLSAIAQHGLARDFWDLHVMLGLHGWSLGDALDAYRSKFKGHVVRSLVYFGDAHAEPLPEGLDAATLQRIESDFRIWVSAL